MVPAARLSDIHDVHRGKDGWLFLVGGSNDVLGFYSRPDAFTDRMVRDWIARLDHRREQCRQLGALYRHMIVPDKITVYHDKFDGELPYRRLSPALRLAQAAIDAGLETEMVDVVPTFSRQRHRHKLFWQTDTHWTFEGCLTAYRVLCRQLGVKPSPAIVRNDSGPDLLLDLGQKLDPPVREEFYTATALSRARRVAANAMVCWKERHGLENDGRLHVGCNVVFCNHHRDAIDQCVVLFGDSFSEYRPHLLSGMLAATFRELHFVWSSSIDWNYVRRAAPDLVITQAAERFAGQVPTDEFDLDRYVVGQLAPLMYASGSGV